ncbi:MAG: glycosyltransferase family 2 protein, partial [Candidatus Helarchaeota archaeon]
AKGKIIVIMDSDYTYPAHYIPNLINPIIENKADLVLGNRLKNIKLESMNFLHLFGNKFLTLTFNILYSSKIQDTQTGFRAFKKIIFKKLNIKSKGIFFPTDFLIQSLKLHLKIEEKYILYRSRLGHSKLNPLRDGLIIFLKMIINRFFK